MDFATWLGISGYARKDILDYALKKLQKSDAEYNDFIACIKKLILAICKEYRKFISKSQDFNDVLFPEEYDKLIYEAVLQAMNKDKPFTIDMLLPKEDISDAGRSCLYWMLKNEFKCSFEYEVRDFISWIRIIEKDQSVQIADIKDRLNKLLELEAKTYDLLSGLIDKKVKLITYQWIQEQRKEAKENEARYKRAYNDISDRDNTISHIVCADFDIINREVLDQAINKDGNLYLSASHDVIPDLYFSFMSNDYYDENPASAAELYSFDKTAESFHELLNNDNERATVFFR